jgi:hypothetical protein
MIRAIENNNPRGGENDEGGRGEERREESTEAKKTR